MIVQRVEMHDGEISIGDDNILRAWAAPGSQETIEEAIHHLEIMRNLANGRRLPALVDLRGIKSTTREAREFYGCDEYAKVVCAAALVVGSSVSRVVGNFYLGLNRGVYPIKLFTDEAVALEWLKRFLE
jgi:hypothetical protein